MFIGNHAVFFGSQIATDTEYVIKQMSLGGSQGIEVGMRFFGADRKEELAALLEKYHLHLAAFHVPCKILEFVDSPKECMELFLKAGTFLQGFPFKNIMMTPQIDTNDLPFEQWNSRLRSPEVLRQAASVIEEIAVKLEQMGVTLLLHNHTWEFMGNGAIFYSFMEHAPHLKLGLDIGWAYAAGFDGLQLLEEYSDRIPYVHLRNYKNDVLMKCKNFTEAHEQAFVEIEQGDLDYKKLLPVVQKTVGPEGWAVVEYEKYLNANPAEAYARATMYLKSLM